MANQVGSLELLAREIGSILEPLQQGLETDHVLELFAELGVQFPQQLVNQAAFTGALSTGATAAAAIPPLIDQLSTDIDHDDVANILLHGGQLISQIAAVVTALDQIAAQLQALANSLPGISPAVVSDFALHLAARLLDFLVVTYFENRHPIVISVLALIGLIERSADPGTPGDPTRPPYTVRKLHLERLGNLVTSPTKYAEAVYGWGSPGFDGTLLLTNVSQFLNELGVSTQVQPATAGGPLTLESYLFQLQPNLASAPPGVVLALHVPVVGGFDLTVPFSPRLSLHLITSGELTAGLEATITPPDQFSLAPPTGTLTGVFQIEVVGNDPSSPFLLLGLTGGSRIEVASVKLIIAFVATWDVTAGKATGDFSIKVQLSDGHAVVLASDSFLSKIFSGGGLDATFAFAAGWSAAKGLILEGAASIETSFALHQSIGPFLLETLHLRLGITAEGLPVEISLSGSGSLGPVAASVDRIGVIGEMKFQRGNLGPVDFGVRFKPPNGLGILIDAGVVTGGGFILFDLDKGEYAGILELSLEFVQVKVIALLDTRLPDGSKGFSFLFIITTDFPPIQLGFGFTLSGVGGLAGINRTMILDVLRNGLKNHILNSILFPPDPIRNAPQIISDVSSVFPPDEGRYVFGPMLEVGWGTPILLRAQLGMILEIPDPVRLAIIGKIELVLPTEEEALIDIQMDILGTIDFGAKKLSIDATLFDSRILVFSISGDMAMRLNWGTNSSFAVAIGGFNSRFLPPPGMPKLNRIALGISFGSYIHLSLTSYQAVTSNSAQFGAAIELVASIAGASLHGYLSFDALFIFSPFSFVVEMQAGIDISYQGVSLLGVHLDAVLSGPKPWHVDGTASFHVLFFSVGVHVQATFGDTRQVTLPGQPVLPALTKALNDRRNWSAALPENSARAVTLATVKPDDQTILVHPMGTLRVDETVVPLDLPIEKFGSARPTDGRQFSIAGVTVNGQPQPNQPVKDSFAPGQFKDLSDADKLAAPSYEPFDAGVTIESTTVSFGRPSREEIHYDTVIVDDPLQPSRLVGLYRLPVSLQDAFLGQGAAALAAVRHTGLVKFLEPGQAQAIVTSQARYVVASTEDLSQRTDLVAGSGTSYAQASAILSDHLAAHPDEASLLQVLPIHEAVIA